MTNIVELQATALFNFLMKKQKLNARIGELSFLDLVELVKFLNGDGAHANR